MTEPGDTVAAVDAEALQREALSAIEAASAPAELDELRVRYLGRRSDLKQALRQVRDRETGMALNATREAIEAAVADKESALERAELDRTLTEDVVDITLPGERLPLGRLHPITQVRRNVENTFLGLGYEVRDDREVETVEYNFDKLAFAPTHPSRSHRDTFFFDDVARPANRDLAVADPRRSRRRSRRSTWSPSVASTGATRSRRRATRSSCSSRASPSTVGSLSRISRARFCHVMRRALRRGARRPLSDALLPVHGALDRAGRLLWHLWRRRLPYVQVLRLDRDGRSRDGRPARLRERRLRPGGMVCGFAFGWGLERAAQLRHDIPDIRHLWEGDLRVLRQF